MQRVESTLQVVIEEGCLYSTQLDMVGYTYTDDLGASDGGGPPFWGQLVLPDCRTDTLKPFYDFFWIRVARETSWRISIRRLIHLIQLRHPRLSRVRASLKNISEATRA